MAPTIPATTPDPTCTLRSAPDLAVEEEEADMEEDDPVAEAKGVVLLVLGKVKVLVTTGLLNWVRPVH